MYAVSPQAAHRWRTLLEAQIRQAGADAEVIEHSAPAPLDELWQRTDLSAVFMCGLPFSRSVEPPQLIAAPVPAASDFAGRAEYWSECVVRADSVFATLQDTFGGRLALTAPNSQSGYAAALQYLMPHGADKPLYAEIVAPTLNPLGAINAVIDGAADVAPVDAFALALLRKYRADLTARVRSVARTARTPIPPLVASVGMDSTALRSAFTNAHRSAELKAVMADLLLDRFIQPSAHLYEALRVDFEAAKAFWRQHPLAAVVHPAFLV